MAPRPSPGAERVVAVLEFLASHPDERFTLSEVSRECDLNKATAHALLTELTGRGVLLRHPDEKRYSLGPRLAPIGQAAERGYRVQDFALPALKRLVATTGATSAALLHDLVDDHATITDQVVADRGVPLPSRWPLVPPVGAMFFAWADDASAEAWLARCPAGGSVRQALEALAVVRRDRVMIGAAVPAWRRLMALLPVQQPTSGRVSALAAVGDAGAFDDVTQEEVRDALYELSRSRAFVDDVEPDVTYEVAYVAAPVFDHTGMVRLAVVSGPHDGQQFIRGRHLRRLAAAVMSIADGLTEAAFGRRPW